jgi:hypothetical protein
MKIYVARNFNSVVMGAFDSLEKLILALIEDENAWQFYGIREHELNTYHKSGWGHTGTKIPRAKIDEVVARFKK